MSTIMMRVAKSGSQYIGECLEFPVMTHGRTLEELSEKMEKALALFLAEDTDDNLNDTALVSLHIALPGEG